MTNPNIQVESRPKIRKKSANLEHKLQAKCVTWFGVTYPENSKALFGYFATTLDERDGGIKTALGLKAGISDLLFVKEGGELWGIEMKHADTEHLVKHLRDQCEFLIKYPARGFFCDSFEMFKGIIQHGSGGIAPRTVLKNLKDVKTLSCSWNAVRE